MAPSCYVKMLLPVILKNKPIIQSIKCYLYIIQVVVLTCKRFKYKIYLKRCLTKIAAYFIIAKSNDMFENTLLIIKADYMRRRKTLLKYLMRRGFQIQGQRRLLFSVEEAAEFYADLVDTPYFMIQVMLLSKGNSEAYILTKKNAVEDMLNILVCYL